REQICDNIDERGFGWQIWLVAGSGFFTESYNLFATNVILPSLAYIYWNGDDFNNHESTINLVTLGGSIVGQLTFGLLADLLGRRKLYGFELIFVIFGTVGLAGCGTGFGNSMSIMGWLIYYRFFVGVGVGAEYPLAGVITSEFAPVQSRARMMVAVTLMQPLGQVAAAAVGLTVLTTLGKKRGLESLTESPDDHKVAAAIIDRIWRIVIGVGAIPAFLAIVARLTIPESPRFTLDVSHDGKQALKANQEYLGQPIVDDYDDVVLDFEGNDSSDRNPFDEEPPATPKSPHPFSHQELKKYFGTEGNWRQLAGVSICWCCLDVAFYGLGIGNPRVVAQIWASSLASDNNAGLPMWGNPADPTLSIYNALYQDSLHYIITISLGSLLGSFVLLKAIDYVPRKAALAWSFLALGVTFAIVGGIYSTVVYTNLHAFLITFYALLQLLFNLGPNTIIFLLAAEIFPTRYRSTCFGIAAASGKLGSVIVQSILPRVNVDARNSTSMSRMLIAFAFVMALGSLFAWAWIPEVQYSRKPAAVPAVLEDGA
ncbi:MFS general substrate transporter, partial [Stipitochalara longipes BDJ]